jgi:hypothetical protein
MEFNDVAFIEAIGTWLKRIFNFIKALAAASRGKIKEPVEEIFELSALLFKMIGRNPLLALEEFGARKTDPRKLDTYLQSKFGDKFNLSEMQSIALLLSFPETASEWTAEKVTFKTLPSRTDSSAPINGRPVQWRTRRRTDASAAKGTFDEMFAKSVPFALIDQLIRSGVPQEKIDEAMGKDDPNAELEKLRKQTQGES